MEGSGNSQLALAQLIRYILYVLFVAVKRICLLYKEAVEIGLRTEVLIFELPNDPRSRLP